MVAARWLLGDRPDQSDTTRNSDTTETWMSSDCSGQFSYLIHYGGSYDMFSYRDDWLETEAKEPMGPNRNKSHTTWQTWHLLATGRLSILIQQWYCIEFFCCTVLSSVQLKLNFPSAVKLSMKFTQYIKDNITLCMVQCS